MGSKTVNIGTGVLAMIMQTEIRLLTSHAIRNTDCLMLFWIVKLIYSNFEVSKMFWCINIHFVAISREGHS